MGNDGGLYVSKGEEWVPPPPEPFAAAPNVADSNASPEAPAPADSPPEGGDDACAAGDDKEDPEVFEVDFLMAHRATAKGTTEYKVRWKGFKAKHDTWEPAENIIDTVLVADYERRAAASATPKAATTAQPASFRYTTEVRGPPCPPPPPAPLPAVLNS
jgi:''chromo'' (CHRromatin Organisation MOdifier) domain.